MGTVTKKVMDSIMDELVWKVAATKEIEIARYIMLLSYMLYYLLDSGLGYEE